MTLRVLTSAQQQQQQRQPVDKESSGFGGTPPSTQTLVYSNPEYEDMSSSRRSFRTPLAVEQIESSLEYRQINLHTEVQVCDLVSLLATCMSYCAVRGANVAKPAVARNYA